MNLILLTAQDLTAAGRAVLRDARADHIRNVLGARPGDSLRVGMVDGLMGLAQLETVDASAVTLRLGTLDLAPPPKLPLLLVMALPRPKMLRRALRTVAELGVPELVLLNSWKVDKSYWQTPELTEPRRLRHLLEGLSQSRDTAMPRIRLEKRFKPFVEDALPGLIRHRQALLADAGATAPCPVSLNRPTALAIGPEGGFTAYETARLQAAGFVSASLGPRILRVDTVLPTLIGRLFT